MNEKLIRKNVNSPLDLIWKQTNHQLLLSIVPSKNPTRLSKKLKNIPNHKYLRSAYQHQHQKFTWVYVEIYVKFCVVRKTTLMTSVQIFGGLGRNFKFFIINTMLNVIQKMCSSQLNFYFYLLWRDIDWSVSVGIWIEFF